MTDGKPFLLAVVGTTASGKSDLAVDLALQLDGEVISADSRQVYRGLDIGSGKITPEEMRGVPHHMLDVCNAGTFFSMADYQRMAYDAIDGVLARGKLPILCGGTGLYVDAVCEGYLLSGIAPDLKYREELETYSTPALAAMLEAAMPGHTVEKGNRNRVMRQLEKLHDGDTAPAGRDPRYRVLKLGVTYDRPVLAERIHARLVRRLDAGMVQEVQGLLDQGVSAQFLYKLGLEYRYVSQYLLGEIPSFQAMQEGLDLAIRQFAKRQMTWFRRDKRILWTTPKLQ